MGLTQVGTGGIKDDAVTSGKILDSEVETSDIKDEAVTLAKLPKGDSNSDGKVLTSNENAAPTFNTPTVEGVDVKSDSITATSPYKFLRADGDGTCSWQAPAGTSVVTDAANGLVPAHPASNENPTDKFLRGDATWAVPSYATLVTDQANGLAPILPTTDPTLKFLRGDRSWQELNYTVSGTTTGDAGTDASVSLSGTEFSFTIPKGDQGIPGAAATISVHSTVTGDAGTSASVTNEGTSSAANFKFTIPRGNTGNTGASGKTILNGSGPPTGSTGGNVGDFYIDTTNNNIYGPKESGGWVGSATSLVGPAGDAATIAAGTVTIGDPGSTATVTNSGSSSAATFDFALPKGDKGDEGDAATIEVGTVTTGSEGSSATVTNSGTSAAATFDFSIPKGDTGDAATIEVGTVTTGSEGSSATVTNSGSSSAATFDFSIPKGDKGDGGDAATISVGTVTTGSPTSSATVTNSGSSSAAVFDFSIPQGATGAAGGLFTSYAQLVDQKASNVHGGAVGSSTGWEFRDLNTEKFDPDGIVLGFNGVSTGTTKSNGSDTYTVTTSTQEFALGSGTYFIRARAPAIECGRSMFYLRIYTDATRASWSNGGSSSTTWTNTATVSSNPIASVTPELSTRFTLTETKLMVIRQYFQGGVNTDSYAQGISALSSFSSSINSIYTVVDIYKE